MSFCAEKSPYVVWDGTNLAAILEQCAPVIFEGSDFTYSVDGDVLTLTFMQQYPEVMHLGDVLVGFGTNSVKKAAYFAEHYWPIPA